MNTVTHDVERCRLPGWSQVPGPGSSGVQNTNEIAGSRILWKILCLVLIAVTTIVGVVKQGFKHRGRMCWVRLGLAIWVIVLIATNIVREVKHTPLLLAYAVSSLITNECETDAFMDPYVVFPDSILFEEAYPAIKREVLPYLEDTTKLAPMAGTYNNKNLAKKQDDGQWGILPISAGGHVTDWARKNLPTVTALVSARTDKIKSSFISILPPGVKIPPHTGYFRGFIRYMLAIKIPKDRDNVYICVNEFRKTWEEGKSMMFDDMHPHAVWNNTKEVRAVLFMDIKREIKSWPLRQVINTLYSTMQNHPVIKAEISRVEKLVQI